jgi:hypothetical protein
VHEKVIVEGGITRLQGDLMHESEEDLHGYLEKQNRYTTLQAASLYEAGKRVAAHRIVTSPLFRFIRFYLLKRGFLDGLPGLVHVLIGCMNTSVKYMKLMEKTHARHDHSASR